MCVNVIFHNVNTLRDLSKLLGSLKFKKQHFDIRLNWFRTVQFS